MKMYTETELMKRALDNAASKRKFQAPLWVVMMEIFAVGKTQAAVICEHYGFDPDEVRNNWAFYEELEEETPET